MSITRRNVLRAAGFSGMGTLLAAWQNRVFGQTHDPCAACLGTGPIGPVPVRGTGIGLHIGINNNDPASYGRITPLSGCHRDADAMARVARSAGIAANNITVLKDRQATAAAVVKQIEQAADTLRSGDLFMLTYAGHGSQIRDEEPRDEPDDGRDETWCLYDRQLRDDHMYTLWKRFREGVRILMINDSCHNGTMARVMVSLLESLPEEPATRDGESLRSLLDPHGVYRGGGAAATRGERGAREVMPEDVTSDTGAVRTLPETNLDGDLIRVEANRLQRDMIAETDAYIRSIDTSRDDEVRASVILLAGCQDNQVCLDGSSNGLFTSNLLRTWNQWQPSRGGYEKFVMAIGNRMPLTQTPNYFVVGRKNADYEQQNPFTI